MKLMLPLVDRYCSFYYMRNYCKLVYDTLEEGHLLIFFVDYKSTKLLDISKVFKCIDDKLLILEKQVEKNLFDDKIVRDYFSKTFGNNILNNYLTIEKIVCDYLNMFKYIINLSQNNRDSRRKSSEVIRIINNDDNDYKIIRTISITLNENTVFLQTKTFCVDGKKILFYKDIDYFVNNFSNLSITSEALTVKNVKKVELTLLVTKLNKKLKVYSFFDVNEDGLI